MVDKHKWNRLLWIGFLLLSFLGVANISQAGLLPYRYDLSVRGTSDTQDDHKSLELHGSISAYFLGLSASVGHGYFAPGQSWNNYGTLALTASYPFPLKGIAHLEPKIGIGFLLSSMQVGADKRGFGSGFLDVGFDLGFPVAEHHYPGKYLQTYATRQIFFSFRYRLLWHSEQHPGNHVFLVGLGYKFSAF